MGNRAVITTEDGWKNCGVGVYLHWNGGRDSVEAFLTYCKMKGYRSPDQDSYGWARLCQVIGNFFEGGSSVGIDSLWHLDCDNGDNGVYIIRGWEIIDRKYFDGVEQKEYPQTDILREIDANMPEREQFGKDFFDAKEIPTNEIEVGDEVYLIDFTGRLSLETVIGIGEERTVNGTNVFGIPYINRYGLGLSNPSSNINNYLRKEKYRVKK